jgi:hypothetical protein
MGEDHTVSSSDRDCFCKFWVMIFGKAKLEACGFLDQGLPFQYVPIEIGPGNLKKGINQQNEQNDSPRSRNNDQDI